MHNNKLNKIPIPIIHQTNSKMPLMVVWKVLKEVFRSDKLQYGVT